MGLTGYWGGFAARKLMAERDLASTWGAAILDDANEWKGPNQGQDDRKDDQHAGRDPICE